MRTREQRSTPTRLNDGLCPSEFEIRVPKSSTLLGINWTDNGRWQRYIGYLKRAYSLESDIQSDCRMTCDGNDARSLRGSAAIAHAREVHQRIHRQVLGLSQVSAIDVGFALRERQCRFANFLSIRVHVNRKQSPEKLAQEGFSSFTQPTFLLGASTESSESESEESPKPEGSANRPSPLAPLMHLRCGSQDQTKQARQKRHIDRLFARDYQQNPMLWEQLSTYPIRGVGPNDFSIYCPLSIEKTTSLNQVRICICGVPIDVINAQYRPAISHPGGDGRSGVFVDEPQRSDELPNTENLLIGRGRVSPLVGGISVGSVTNQAGTLATIVWDRTDGTPCMLSNWHVLAGSSHAKVGQPIYQPARFDGGTETDVVGHLKRWHFGEQGDAALAELTHGRPYATGEVLGLWSSIAGTIEPRLNLEVRKWGRSTGFTKGFIDGIDLATNIEYGSGVVRSFRNQFHIAPLYLGEDVSQVGDSGSLVVTSFEPSRIESDLETTQNWLRACCEGQASFTHTREIPASLKKLEECQQVGDVSKLLSHLRTDLDKYCNSPTAADNSGKQGGSEADDQRSPKVEGNGRDSAAHEVQVAQAPKQENALVHLASASIHLANLSENLRDRLESAAFLRERLWRVYEAWFLRHELPNDAHTTANHLIADIKRCCQSALSEKWPEDLGKDSGAPGSIKLCQSLETAQVLVQDAVRRLERSVEFAADLGEKITSWQEQCEQVSNSESDFGRLCKAFFHLQNKVPHLNPRQLVRHLEEAIEEIKKNEPSKTSTSVNQEASKSTSNASKNESRPASDSESRTIGQENPEEKDSETSRRGERKRVKRAINDWLDGAGLDVRDPSRLGLLQAVASILPWSTGTLDILVEKAAGYIDAERQRQARQITRSYYAVGMIFAGDTPGSPFGEFAIASDISVLEKELRFSLRPVYEPRSSFRELRTRPDQPDEPSRSLGAVSGLQPGDQVADSRGGGPQPEIEPAQSSGTGG